MDGLDSNQIHYEPLAIKDRQEVCTSSRPHPTYTSTTWSVGKGYKQRIPVSSRKALTLSTYTPKPRGVYSTIEDWGHMLLGYMFKYIDMKRNTNS